MEHWAAEVEAGEPFKVELDENRALHLSLACIGEVDKDSSEFICLFVNINGKKLALGTLHSEKLCQQSFDLVFDKTFELSHNWKNGSVIFHGYTADNDISDNVTKDNSDSDSYEESDEGIPVMAPNGGPASEVKQEDSKINANKNSSAGKHKAIVESKKDASSEDNDDSSDDDATSSEDDPKVSAGKDSAAGKQKVKMVKPKKETSAEDNDDTSDDDGDATSSEDVPEVGAGKDAAAGKQKAKIVEPNNDASSEDDADSSDDDDAMSEDDSEDNEDNKSASDENGDKEEEVTPVQVKSSKKRDSVSASKKNVPEKKAKLITPPKADGKKSSVHVATPYPSKQTGKTAATRPNQPTPKSEGSHLCKSCKKILKTEQGLESHIKAKHSGGK